MGTGEQSALEQVAVREEDLNGRSVMLIELNRPEQRNALNTLVLKRLLEAYDLADSSEGIGAVIMSGAGSTFCAGGDLKEFSSPQGGEARLRGDLLLEVLTRPSKLSVPVIAAVHGAAMGAGAALALSADIVVARRDFVMGLPELPKGKSPSLVMPPMIGQLGPKVTFEMVATGRRVGAEEARAAGAVNLVVDDNPVAEARALVERFIQLPAGVLAETKAMLYRQAALPLELAFLTGSR